MEDFRQPNLKDRSETDGIQHMADCSWDEIDCSNVRRFQFGDYPEIIYVIKTGFEDTYLVVVEDAYHLHLGKTSIMTKKKVERKFKIKL
jgi:hypothetical protein